MKSLWAIIRLSAKDEQFPPRLGTSQQMFLSHLLNIVLEILASRRRQFK